MQEKSAQTLAAIVAELERGGHDPQLVLTSLVKLYALLSSSSSSASLSLPSGLKLSQAAKMLQKLMQDYLDSEEEIVWFLCRTISAWSRSSHRFKLEAGHIRTWEILKFARLRYPESPRVLEASLEATALLFDGVELHQLLAPREPTEDKLIDELLQLIDHFDKPPPRTVLLSPRFDFSRIVVYALDVLCKLFASPRIVTTDQHRHANQYVRPILERMQIMVAHFLKSPEASRTWLTMCRLQLQYAPPLALTILFAEKTGLPYWCQQLTSTWCDDPRVVYEFAAVFTQVFAVPHGSKVLPSTILNSEICHAIILDHGVLGILIDLHTRYSQRANDTSTRKSDVDRLQPIILEILRSIRQFSCVPEMLTAFPNVPLAKKALVPAIVAEVDRAVIGLRNGSQDSPQYHMRVLLEVALILQQIAQLPVFARIIKSADVLSTHLGQALKRVSSIQASSSASFPNNAGDGDLPAVLQRELYKTTKVITAIPALPPSHDKLSLASRGLQRLPTSSNTIPPPRSPSITRSTLTSSSTLVSSSSRRTFMSSSSSTSLVRTSRQQRL